MNRGPGIIFGQGYCEMVYVNPSYQTNHMILAQMIISDEENIPDIACMWLERPIISVFTHTILAWEAAIRQMAYRGSLVSLWCNCGLGLHFYKLIINLWVPRCSILFISAKRPCIFIGHFCDVTRVPLHLKSSAIALIVSQFVFAKKHMKHQRSAFIASCKGNPPVTNVFHSQRASNVETVTMSCRYHAYLPTNKRLVRNSFRVWI